MVAMFELDMEAGSGAGVGEANVVDDDIESVEIIKVLTNCSKRFDFSWLFGS